MKIQGPWCLASVCSFFCGEVSNEWVWLSLFVAKSHVRNTRPKTNSEWKPLKKMVAVGGTSPLPSSFGAKPGLFSGANWLFKPPPGQGSLNRISTIPQNMANLCKSGKLTNLRIFQTYPWNIPWKTPELFQFMFRNSFHLGVKGEAWGLIQGYVGVLLETGDRGGNNLKNNYLDVPGR